jgi:hypothetical protein
MYISLIVGSLQEQSDNFEGNEPLSNGDFLLVASLASCDLIRASLAKIIFLKIKTDSSGFSKINFSNTFEVTSLTNGETSVLPNSPLVCPLYCG